jgi:Saf4/Yju2 protein
MGERKVVNKYYPPDFDPLKLKKPKMPPDKQVKTRMMLPFTCKCSVCGTYLHIGTKFNMRKETVTDEEYLGIEIIRFFFKCTRCTTEITMKTDPKNHDYVCEANASRQYDERRDLESAENALLEMKIQEDQDPMKFLEARTYESRREMDILDALGNILELNKVQGKVDFEMVIQELMEKRRKAEEDKKIMEKLDISQEEIRLGFVKRIDEEEAEKEALEKLKFKNQPQKRKSYFNHTPKFIIKKAAVDNSNK